MSGVWGWEYNGQNDQNLKMGSAEIFNYKSLQSTCSMNDNFPCDCNIAVKNFKRADLMLAK